MLQLPPPFANTIHLSLEPVSAFDEAGTDVAVEQHPHR